MRFRSFLLAAVTCAIALLPSVAFAQYSKFQPPTEEELKMTEEPKAPGAAAVYLYREETVDDEMHYHSLLARIKILAEKGKEMATVEIPYPKGVFSITDIKARTIHPDGTIIPLDIKPTDLVESKRTHSQINAKVFTLPSVEVGSILEYRWQLRYESWFALSPSWLVQQRYFVRKAHYSFTPSRFRLGAMFTYRLRAGERVVKDDSHNRFTLDLTDIPPIPQEDYMPPLWTLTEQVRFYYTQYPDSAQFWKAEGAEWSRRMDHFAAAKPSLREAVQTIVSPADNEETKARKLYDAVMALENTDYTRTKTTVELKQEGLKEVRTAEDVWKAKSGSSDDIAMLYLDLAREAGLSAYAMAVCDRDKSVFDKELLWMGQLDNELVVVSINGKEIALDPGERFADFGQLAWQHTMSAGLRQTANGVIFVQTPENSYREAITARVADVAIDRDGAITGSARITLNGPAALHWRQATLENDEDEVKKQFDESIRDLLPDGVHAEFQHFLGLEDFHAQLMGVVKLSGNLGTTTGKRVFLPGVFFESHARHPFVAEQSRPAAVDMQYAETVQDQVTYRLAEGLTAESAPPDTSIPWAGKAVFRIKSTVDGNKIDVVRTLARNFTLLPSQDYSALHDFYLKVSTADQQQVVLTTTKPSAGN
jgi:Domain of Unknown Function with PDB structure (DUF3857)/Transglutaminase-like superfamily